MRADSGSWSGGRVSNGAGELLGETQSGQMHEIGFSLYTEMLGRTVHLILFVKVDPKWMERREAYASVGLEFDA